MYIILCLFACRLRWIVYRPPPPRSTAGADSEIFPFAAVGARPQDLKYRGEVSETRLGARCQVHHHAHVCGGTAHGGGRTTIGAHRIYIHPFTYLVYIYIHIHIHVSICTTD